ncbi:hypothetical protein PSHT_04941 [Puccinia striiformis]|uniref:Uncharacterized protein n=1 Tax=Puccinia striiformis TaxID=27350 RepID=A0A2S4WBV2_9BASI|nr:hypothetical protein PSHT_04941 [Puccinia striiformis]
MLTGTIVQVTQSGCGWDSRDTPPTTAVTDKVKHSSARNTVHNPCIALKLDDLDNRPSVKAERFDWLRMWAFHNPSPHKPTVTHCPAQYFYPSSPAHFTISLSLQLFLSTNMKTTPTSLQNGLMPTTVANLHSQLSTCGIPSGNSTFARSIHDFTRIVLGVEAANSDLPPAPPQSQLTTFVTPSNDALATGVILACFRSYLSEHDLSALEVGGRIKCIPLICRQFFVEDMSHINVHYVSFAWGEDPDSKDGHRVPVEGYPAPVGRQASVANTFSQSKDRLEALRPAAGLCANTSSQSFRLTGGAEACLPTCRQASVAVVARGTPAVPASNTRSNPPSGARLWCRVPTFGEKTRRYPGANGYPGPLVPSLPDSPYNAWFAGMLWKHWTFAKNNGFLHKYAISPTDDTADIGKLVLFRWVHGRQADLQKAARNLNWRQLKAAREKRSKRKKQVRLHRRLLTTAAITLTLTLLYVFTRALLQLSDHHFDTCVALVVPAPLTRIFMNPACTSDTEEEDAGNLYRMHVPWRSQELSQFARKLDEATVERLRKEKGDRYVKRAKLLELR